MHDHRAGHRRLRFRFLYVPGNLDRLLVCALLPAGVLLPQALTDVNKTVEAHDILRKQYRMRLIHPVSFVITQAVSGIPVSILITVTFYCCYHLLVGLSITASHFWIFALITFT